MSNDNTGETLPLADWQKEKNKNVSQILGADGTPLESKSKIDETTVPCPNQPKAFNVMSGWGEKKRQRYAHLVIIGEHPVSLAYYMVEYNNGNEKL